MLHYSINHILSEFQDRVSFLITWLNDSPVWWCCSCSFGSIWDERSPEDRPRLLGQDYKNGPLIKKNKKQTHNRALLPSCGLSFPLPCTSCWTSQTFCPTSASSYSSCDSRAFSDQCSVTGLNPKWFISGTEKPKILKIRNDPDDLHDETEIGEHSLYLLSMLKCHTLHL